MTDFDAYLQHIIDHVNDRVQAPQKYLDEWKQKIQHEVDQLRQAGVISVASLYELIGNEQAEIPLRQVAISILQSLIYTNSRYAQPSLPKIIDSRRAVAPVLRAAQSSNEELYVDAIWALGAVKNKRTFKFLVDVIASNPAPRIQQAAIHSLGRLDDPRSFEPLAAIITDRAADARTRVDALLGLTSDERLAQLVLPLIEDPTENLEVRWEAIQWLGISNNELAQVYNRLLQNENAYIRFWAAYGWAQTFEIDTSAALTILDNLVAFDHTPEPTMWHVSREAMRGFEMAWYSQLTSIPDHTYYGTMYLISPLLEFYDYQRKIYYWDESQRQMIATPFEQTTTLDIDAAWLAEQIRVQWPDAKFNVRQPQPECLRLDWQIDLPTRMLIGGLHRDGYLIMLTCDDEDAAAFAIWLRGIITAEQVLRFYDWAGFGIAIKPDMTPAQLVELSDNAPYTYDDPHTLAEA